MTPLVRLSPLLVEMIRCYRAKQNKKRTRNRDTTALNNTLEIQQWCSRQRAAWDDTEGFSIGAGKKAEKTNQINDRRLERLADTTGTRRPAKKGGSGSV